MELGQNQVEALDLWRRVTVTTVRSDAPDLTARQMAVLMTVRLQPAPHTVRGLAATLNVGKPAITRALDTLSRLGFVQRRRDLQMALVGLYLLGREASFGGQFVPLLMHRGDGLFASRGRVVEQQYPASRLRRDLRDAAPHGSGAHDADTVEFNMHCWIMIQEKWQK